VEIREMGNWFFAHVFIGAGWNHGNMFEYLGCFPPYNAQGGALEGSGRQTNFGSISIHFDRNS
jgi:hypothetical protein